MDVVAAWRMLGLDPSTTRNDTRRHYRSLLFQSHPDRCVGANELDLGAETRDLIEAFRVLEGSVDQHEAPEANPSEGSSFEGDSDSNNPAEFTSGKGNERGTPDAGDVDESQDEIGTIRILERDTISVRAPVDETFARMLEAGAAIGEITYLDRHNELFESLLKTVDGDAVSLVCTLQGRADETTEAFFTMEPLGVARHPLPDLVDVVALLADHLRSRW